MKRFVVAASILPALPAPAYAQKEVDKAFASEMARYDEQKSSAENDIALADKTLKYYFSAAKYSKGPVQNKLVNEALSPLRSKYPDYRLRYASPSDYCPVLHAIEDAVRAARVRLTSALYKKQRILALSTAYHEAIVQVVAGELLGDAQAQDAIARAFTLTLEATKQDIEIGWSGMDYFEADPAFGADDCGK